MVTNGLAAPHRPSRRPAFSLAELVVSVAVLILMLGLAGQVLTITVNSTGQATGLTEVNVQLRVLEDLLRRDLAAARHGRTPMLIQGNPVNAYWTREHQEADNDTNPSNGGYQLDPALQDAEGDPVLPRADILMFFTERRAESYLSPDVFTHMQHVVYGHAELGEYEYVVDGKESPPEFQDGLVAFPVDGNGYPSRTAPSPVAAAQWYLARRVVGLLPGGAPDGVDANTETINLSYMLDGVPLQSLGDEAVRRGQIDLARLVEYDRYVVGSWGEPPWRLPYIFFQNPEQRDALDPWNLTDMPHARSEFDPAPPAAVANRLGHALLPSCASFKVEWTLSPRSEFVAGRLDGTREVIWLDPGEVDPTTDADEPNRALFVAGQTEFDDGSTVVAPQLVFLATDRTAHPNGDVYSLEDRFNAGEARWQDVGGLILDNSARNNIALFLARMRRVGELAGDPRDPEVLDPDPPAVPLSEEPLDDVFPSALRITVDVYDRQGRLDKPVRHVMVIPVGGT